MNETTDLHRPAEPRSLRRLAQQLRVDAIRAVATAGSGHPSSAPSAADLMAEDIAMFRAVHGSTVLVASDAHQTAGLTAAMLDRSGVVYLRTMRMATPVLYDAAEVFPVGGSRVLRASERDDVALLAAGVTVHEALAASEALAREGPRARVVVLYSVEPLDAGTVVEAARATGRVVVAEYHWRQG